MRNPHGQRAGLVTGCRAIGHLHKTKPASKPGNLLRWCGVRWFEIRIIPPGAISRKANTDSSVGDGAGDGSGKATPRSHMTQAACSLPTPLVQLRVACASSCASTRARPQSPKLCTCALRCFVHPNINVPHAIPASSHTPGQEISPRGHGHLCDRKLVGVFVSLI